MFRYLYIFFYWSLFVNANGMKFVESKYHYALDTTFKQAGVISFSKDYIEIKYIKKSKILRYTGNTLLTEYKGKKETLNLDTNPTVKLFFLLFDAVYFEKKNILASYFTVEKEKSQTSLTPNDKISSFIEKVSYRKEKNKLVYMKILLTNKDRIKIEEVD